MNILIVFSIEMNRCWYLGEVVGFYGVDFSVYGKVVIFVECMDKYVFGKGFNNINIWIGVIFINLGREFKVVCEINE